MAGYFLFAPNDGFLAHSLTAEEIRGIRIWQDTRLNYEFSWLIEWICDSANCSSKAPRKVLQEVDADERYLDSDFFQQLSMGALGRCKICKQRVWRVSDIRARDREADKKIDLPLSTVREYEKGGKAKPPEDY